MKAWIVIGALVAVLYATHAWPQATPGYVIHQLTYPQSTETLPYGINDRPAAHGDVVGSAYDFNGSQVRFVKYGSTFLKFALEEDPCHFPKAINNARVIVGHACPDLITDPDTFRRVGFVYVGSSREHQARTLDFIAFPGADHTEVNGLNDANVVIGNYYIDEPVGEGAFIFDGDTFMELPPVEGWSVQPSDINNLGQVVGTLYQSETGLTQGFLYEKGGYQFFNHPSATYAWVTGINDHGHIVGFYSQPATDETQVLGVHYGYRGFLYKDGTFTTIRATKDAQTVANGINNAGHIVGIFYRPYDDWFAHGFVAVPKPPAKAPRR